MRCSGLFACVTILAILLWGPGLSPVARASDRPGPDASLWTLLDSIPAERGAVGRPWVRPVQYQAVLTDLDAIRSALQDAPLESQTRVQASPFVFMVPMPDGRFARFQVVESPIMHPELARKFPEIRTYLGQGIDDPHASIRFDVTPSGFHAQVISPNGWYYIDPYTQGDTALYTSYYKRDLGARPDFECHNAVAAIDDVRQDLDTQIAERALGDTRREYRLVVCATGEYTIFHGGTVALGQAAVVTAINRVTGVYETELAVRLNLVANNDLVVYTNSGTDPFNNLNDGTMLTQTINTCNAVIGSANYDVGHSFGTGGGGVAGLGVVCTASKARGTTGLPSPTGDAFYIDFVAHEMGHQFGGNHTFNGTGGNCAGGNRNASTAYEPGSGSTIMAYAGICGAADNIQNNSDAYFHFISLQEINNFIAGPTGGACDNPVATGNSPPTVNAGSDYTIPSGTPFTLTAVSSSDPDGDPVTYCWEERDLGAAQPASGAGAADNGSSPLFRSRTPIVDPFLTRPNLTALLLSQYNNKGERLPTTNRSLNFRCTVRDNRAGAGGTGFDDMLITVTTAGGAFSVTSPNTNVAWSGVQTVTWNVAGTNGAPVNCANVQILLSTNGGNAFSTVLLASTPNDGSEQVTLPNITTTQARIRVAAVGNIFFDQSNSNFSISPAAPSPPTGAAATPNPVCPGAATDLSASGSGGTVVMDWFTGSCGGTLVGTGNPLNVSPLASATYYARTRDTSNGLSSAGCDSVNVVVYAVPPDPTGADASASPICDGNSTDLMATLTCPNDVVDWYTGSCGGSLVGTGSPLHVSPAATTTYYAQARDTVTTGVSAGCDQVTVVVYVAGDANGDTFVNVDDADAFANVLLNAPSGQDCAADMDGDGDADADDIQLFVLAVQP